MAQGLLCLHHHDDDDDDQLVEHKYSVLLVAAQAAAATYTTSEALTAVHLSESTCLGDHGVRSHPLAPEPLPAGEGHGAPVLR